MLERLWRNWDSDECKVVKPLWKTDRKFLKKLNIDLP